MSGLEAIKTDLKGIGSILTDSNSFVPKYQRSYAWEEDHVRDLFNDIGAAIDGGANEYFLGSIVISQKIASRPEIVDGQQRLATISIFLAAIRDYFYNLNTPEGKDRASVILSDYLAKKDLKTLENLPKIHLNDADHDYFVKKILSLPDSSDRQIEALKNSHKRINIAAKIAKQHIDHIVGIGGAPAEALLKWIDFIKERVKVITVEVPDESNAFVIFETLNDRGLALAVSDLLKNYLFYKSDDRITEVQSYWIQMLSVIENLEDEQAVINYIRHFWSSTHGLVREKVLFDSVKNAVTSKSEAVALARGLFESSKIYSAMITCDDTYWEQYGSKAKDNMEQLNEFGMIQMRPLLLSLLNIFTPQETIKAMDNLLNWAVRFLIVGGLGGGVLENKYCEAAVKVSKRELPNAEKLIEHMLNVIPNDSSFATAFSTATVSKNYLARYYLRTLETLKRSEIEPEMTPNKRSDMVSLEHILPENPSAAWGVFTKEEVEANYKKLGNMTLLKKSLNSSIGNQGFEVKKNQYQTSDYLITKEIVGYASWSVENILKRQKELSQIAIKAWPMKV